METAQGRVHVSGGAAKEQPGMQQGAEPARPGTLSEHRGVSHAVTLVTPSGDYTQMGETCRAVGTTRRRHVRRKAGPALRLGPGSTTLFFSLWGGILARNYRIVLGYRRRPADQRLGSHRACESVRAFPSRCGRIPLPPRNGGVVIRTRQDHPGRVSRPYRLLQPASVYPRRLPGLHVLAIPAAAGP